MKKELIIIVFAVLLCMCAQAKKKVKIVDLSNLGHLNPTCVPTVSTEDDDVTLSADSTIYDVTIVIRDQYGNVMHQSTQTISPMESTIFVPDNGDGCEKSTIDLYYDSKHLRGDFDE